MKTNTNHQYAHSENGAQRNHYSDYLSRFEDKNLIAAWIHMETFNDKQIVHTDVIVAAIKFGELFKF